MTKLSIFIFLGVMISSCVSNNDVPDKKAYSDSIETWRTQRLERLKSKSGWLNLAGLYWLKEGSNTFGSDSSNYIIFPDNAPPFCGTIFLEGKSVSITAKSGAGITSDGNPVETMDLRDDTSPDPTVLNTGTLEWFIVKRDEKYGVRLRDFNHPRLNQLDSIPAYPVSLKWRITADFVPFSSVKKMDVSTITGGIETNDCPGTLTFKAGGEKCTLLPFVSGKGFFIIFADKTSGVETYGVGRFMQSDGPDENNKVILDFNKAYNPPCAFSPYATCPMPPRENILGTEIKAGEKHISQLAH